MKRAIRVRDFVRVKLAGGGLGDTRYEVVTIGRRCRCTIREIGPAPNGKPYAEQTFDTSMLAVDNTGPKLLAELFQFGGR